MTVDEWKEVKQQLHDQRELEREMLARVRGLVVHEYYELEVQEFSEQLWFKKRVKSHVGKKETKHL